MNPKHPSEQHSIYVQRINRVLDYIYSNLDSDLSLERLAYVAGFSPFHFHRIFKAMVNETVSQFVWRARVEHGALLLRSNPELSVSEVAAANGFTSLAGFSRAFKQRFGLPPTRWITHEPLQDISYLRQSAARPATFEVKIHHIPAQRLAYVRVYDSYRGRARIEHAYHRLLTWYMQCGGRLVDTVLYGMSQDDPDITPRELCRFDWCLRVPDDWLGDGDIVIRDFPACQVAAVSMTGDTDLEGQIWQYLWRCWLPASTYQPADLPAMEIYRRMPHETGWWTSFHLDCAIPIAPL